MELESLASLGRVEIERKISDKLTVKLKSLSAIEYAKVMKGAGSTAPQDDADLSALGHLASLQVSTLAYATVSINGQSGTPDEFRKIYEVMQYPLVLEVYRVYMEILTKQNEVLEELKKNLTTNQLLEKTT